MTASKRNLKDKKNYSYSGPYKKGLQVAQFYGFDLAGPLRGISSIKQNTKRTHYHKERYTDPIHKTAIHALFAEKYLPKNSTTMVSTTHNPTQKNNGGINLYILGSKKSIGEALVIKAATSVLHEYGHKNLIVDINSLGDILTYKNFLKDFSSHYRKNIDVIGDCCRTQMKQDPSLLSGCTKEECAFVRNEAPRTVNYLSEGAREHLKGVLEYLEAAKIAYRINCDLIGESLEFGTQTAFTISEVKQKKNGVENKIVARGERYTRAPLNEQNRRVSPTVCASIDVPNVGKEAYKIIKDTTTLVPNLYLIHLGVEAKRKSLDLIETLRSRDIQVAQSLIHDGLSKQIQRAENLHVPYTIIMGLKEVKDRAVIVRNMNTRAQETVPISRLPRYIKYIHRL